MTDRQLVVVAALFAVFLTACDQLFHVRTDTLVYHWGPQVWGQTVIVPVTFFLAGVAMLAVSRRAQPPQARPRRVALSLGLATAAYLVSGLLDPDLAATSTRPAAPTRVRSTAPAGARRTSPRGPGPAAPRRGTPPSPARG